MALAQRARPRWSAFPATVQQVAVGAFVGGGRAGPHAAALGDATRGRFHLIDIRLAPGARSPTLTRFVQAVKRLSLADR